MNLSSNLWLESILFYHFSRDNVKFFFLETWLYSEKLKFLFLYEIIFIPIFIDNNIFPTGTTAVATFLQ